MDKTMTITTLDNIAITTGLQVFTNQLKRGNVELMASEPFGNSSNAQIAVRHDDGTIGVYGPHEITSYPSKIVHDEDFDYLFV
jgi:hypothetical protein